MMEVLRKAVQVQLNFTWKNSFPNSDRRRLVEDMVIALLRDALRS